MPLDARDELGPVPPEVSANLTACFDRGPRPAVRANVALASGVLVVVPDRSNVAKYTAIGAMLAAVRAAHTPWLAVDPQTDLEEVSRWVRELPETSGSVRVLVTGPRGTRWHDGDVFAMRMVANLA